MTNTPPSAQEAKGSTRNLNLDCMKLILSVFVVAIHAELDLGVFTPLLRTAVPLFFLTSGYFYFQKLNRCQNAAERRCVLLRFLKRNATLYAVWFVLLSPVTFYVRDWFDEGLGTGLVRFFQSLLFNSTFRASWYISALCLGMLIVHGLSRLLRPGVLVCLTLPVYLFCCLFTNYARLADALPPLTDAYRAYLTVFTSFANSFPAALFWLSLANLFSTKKPSSKRVLLPAAALGLLLLLAEGALVSSFSLRDQDDCYLALILLCPAVFLLVLGSKPCRALFLRRAGDTSTLFYTTHASFITVFRSLFTHVLPPEHPAFSPLLFCTTLLFCALLCVLIFRLERFRPWNFLRLSH